MTIVRLVLSSLVGALVLAGCSSGTEPTAPATDRGTESSSTPTSEPSSEAPEATSPLDLSAGLLPASSFAADAMATSIAPTDLVAGDPGQLPEGATLDPPECANTGASYAAATNVAGQQVTIPQGVLFLQAIRSPFQGTAQDPAVADTLFGGCSASTLTLADGTQVDQALSPLDIGDPGDASAGRTLSNSVLAPNGQQSFSMILFGDVVDGDRVISLAMFVSGATEPFTAAVVSDLEGTFGELVANGYDYQHDVLG